jgi:hypothetical protein
MRTILIAALLAATSVPASAGQFLYNNGAGAHYSRPFPNYGQRWLAPRGAYLQGYLAPEAILGGIIAGAMARAAPPPAYYGPPVAAPPDAIAEIPNATTRQEVVDALNDYCGIKPGAEICHKLQPR